MMNLKNTCMVVPMPPLISSVKPVNLLGSLNARYLIQIQRYFPEFGAEWSCTISRAGDYLLGTWLHVVTPHVALKSTEKKVIYWAPNFMHALVRECCITFNDLVAARFDSAHLDFWAAFTVPASKQAGYARMIGAALPSAGKEIMPQVCNLPLPFFYSRDSGVALPTVALPYNEMRISFTFREARDLLVALDDNTTLAGSLQNCTTSQAGLGVREKSYELVKEPSLGSNAVQVWANYAIVSNEERKRMACAPRDILIEQVQTMPTNAFTQTYQNSSTLPTQSVTVAADIRFSHAVKVLFFAAKNTTNPAVHSNYTTGFPVLTPVDENVCVWDSAQSDDGELNAAVVNSTSNGRSTLVVTGLTDLNQLSAAGYQPGRDVLVGVTIKQYILLSVLVIMLHKLVLVNFCKFSCRIKRFK